MSRIGTAFRKCSFSRPRFLVTTTPASSSTRRCFMTPKRVMGSRSTSSPSDCPSRANSSSSRERRVGSARALNTSSMGKNRGDHLVTCQRSVPLDKVHLSAATVPHAIHIFYSTPVILGSSLISSRALVARAGLLALVLLPLAPPPTRPLYVPRAIARAYRNGTRSASGKPGANYWQNRARYSITVTALPPARAITGSENITYFSNSPDTLRNVGMKLFMNIHRPGAPNEAGATDAYLTSGVHVDSFAVNGARQKWNDDPHLFTTRRVDLPAPLMPHDSLHLSVSWHYDMSREAGREGMLDSTTYYLAYFYPRVSVYDDYNGWDDMTFTDDQEFYSDFNDYDVTVRAPSNFVLSLIHI